MKCPNCNNELFQGTKVCPFCSTVIEQTPNDSTMPLNQQEANDYQPPVNPEPQETYYQPPVNNQPTDSYYQPPVNNNQQQGQYYQPQGNPQNNFQGNYYQSPVNPADPYAQQYQQTDPIAEANANSAKTLGIVSIVFAFLIPIVSWICGGIGLNKAKKVLYINPYNENAKKAKTLCTVGIVLGIVLWIINIFISQYLMDGIFDSFMY